MPTLSLRELENEARKCLDHAIFDYLAGGADDEVTLRANEAAFRNIGLLPRVLSGVGRPRLSLTLLGSHIVSFRQNCTIGRNQWGFEEFRSKVTR